MTKINATGLSAFQLRELLRKETGDPPWWTGWGDEGEELLYLEIRHPSDRRWAITATFQVSLDEFPLVAVALSPATLWPPRGGLTAEVWRGVRINDLHSMAQQAARLPLGVGLGLKIEVDRRGRVRRPGRRGRDDLFYAGWAAKYLDSVATGPAPLARLADKEHLNESTIRGILQEARRRGLLTEPPPGRAGGQLTDKALALLGIKERDGSSLGRKEQQPESRQSKKQVRPARRGK
ncbi:MAG TPA: hypothetical protein VN648_07550 [Candidatus Methylomirabilis sp.]|nr:hypothetical protein [Candidatus Methylomirabilis sp.]